MCQISVIDTAIGMLIFASMYFITFMDILPYFRE